MFMNWSLKEHDQLTKIKNNCQKGPAEKKHLAAPIHWIRIILNRFKWRKWQKCVFTKKPDVSAQKIITWSSFSVLRFSTFCPATVSFHSTTPAGQYFIQKYIFSTFCPATVSFHSTTPAGQYFIQVVLGQTYLFSTFCPATGSFHSTTPTGQYLFRWF